MTLVYWWLSQPRPGVSGSGVYKILYILIKGPANTIHLPLAANTDDPLDKSLHKQPHYPMREETITSTKTCTEFHQLKIVIMPFRLRAFLYEGRHQVLDHLLGRVWQNASFTSRDNSTQSGHNDSTRYCKRTEVIFLFWEVDNDILVDKRL